MSDTVKGFLQTVRMTKKFPVVDFTLDLYMHSISVRGRQDSETPTTLGSHICIEDLHRHYKPPKVGVFDHSKRSFIKTNIRKPIPQTVDLESWRHAAATEGAWLVYLLVRDIEAIMGKPIELKLREET